MGALQTDHGFAGSIPQIYERYLVPLIFVSYAAELTARVASRKPGHVLEIAAGTGVVTRMLVNTLPPSSAIVATDLNQVMLDHAATVGTTRPIQWRQADAMELPFPNESFDAVVCQFGAMFFPDKSKAYAEVNRVLRPGGLFAFNVWDRIEDNEFADVITKSLAPHFPNDPPRFLARVPYGYYELPAIAQQLSEAGFDRPATAITLAKESHAESARIPAVAFCEGTPLRNEIEARAPGKLGDATQWATDALVQRFGAGPITTKIQAHIILIGK